MYVYEICSCEEYQWQESHGLYATEQGAVARARELCREQVEDRGRSVENVSVVRYGDELTLILVGLWTYETFEAWRELVGDYWWYGAPFEHVGAFAVIRCEVTE